MSLCWNALHDRAGMGSDYSNRTSELISLVFVVLGYEHQVTAAQEDILGIVRELVSMGVGVAGEWV